MHAGDLAGGSGDLLARGEPGADESSLGLVHDRGVGDLQRNRQAQVHAPPATAASAPWTTVPAGADPVRARAASRASCRPEPSRSLVVQARAHPCARRGCPGVVGQRAWARAGRRRHSAYRVAWPSAVTAPWTDGRTVTPGQDVITVVAEQYADDRLARVAARASATDARAPAQSMVRVRTRTHSTESTSSLSSRTSRVRPSVSGEPAAPTSMGLLVPSVASTCVRQPLAQGAGERRNLEALGCQRVRSQHPDPAGVAQHRDPPALRERLLAQQQRGLGEVIGVRASDDPRLGEQRVDPDGGRRCGRRVRGTGSLAAAGASSDHGQQRLALAEPPRDAGELRGVPEGLEIERRSR